MIFTRALVLLSLLAVTACTQFPELDSTVGPEVEDAAYPTLLPLEPILAQSNSVTIDPISEEASLQGRLAGLRKRADNLRGSVLSGREKQRLEEALR